jgi:hypothetical protein
MVLARTRCRMREKIVSHTSVEMEEEEGDAPVSVNIIIEAGFFSASSENRLPPFLLKFVE